MLTPMINSLILTSPSSLQSPGHAAAAYAPKVVRTHINSAIRNGRLIDPEG